MSKVEDMYFFLYARVHFWEIYLFEENLFLSFLDRSNYEKWENF